MVNYMILHVAQQAPGPHAYTQRYMDTFRGMTSLHHSQTVAAKDV